MTVKCGGFGEVCRLKVGKGFGWCVGGVVGEFREVGGLERLWGLGSSGGSNVWVAENCSDEGSREFEG